MAVITTPPVEPLEDALIQTSFATMAVLSRLAADHDLSLTQLRVMGILRDRRLRMTALADYLGLEKSTLSGLVDRAERRGLLARAANDRDGRAIDVFLTAPGAELAEQVHSGVGQALLPLTATLSSTDRRRMQVLLNRMLAPHQLRTDIVRDPT